MYQWKCKNKESTQDNLRKKIPSIILSDIFPLDSILDKHKMAGKYDLRKISKNDIFSLIGVVVEGSKFIKIDLNLNFSFFANLDNFFV